MDINLIIATIIGMVSFGISYAAFNKIFDNADAWIRKKCNEDSYEKVNFGMATICIVIIIVYGLSLIFKYV